MIWTDLIKLEKEKTPHCVITLTSVRGEAPQDIGAKCVVTDQGLIGGTVGGGKIEAYAIEQAKNRLQTKQFDLFFQTLNLQTDIGMTCGGEVEFLYEFYCPSTFKVVIFGAGHVSQALARALSKLRCHLTVIDPRHEWLNKLGDIPHIQDDHPANQVKNFDKETFFISMTKGHAHDVPILAEIFRCFGDVRFVGVIGSKQKATAIANDLRLLEVEKEFIDKIHCPIGLELGSNDPEEIAISITAQLLKLRGI